MEKVLVTGGSGYIALHCIAELLKENYHANFIKKYGKKRRSTKICFKIFK